MRTFHKFKEDLDQRRQQLKQKQQDRLQKFKDNIESEQSARREAQDRENMKNEIKKELRSEK